jgi:hypothetical protein
MNVPAIIEKLEQMKIRLSEGSFNQIKLLEAESGSLILHVEINNLCFITKVSLHKAIAEFLHRVFKMTSISGNLDESVANQQNKNKCVEYFKRYSETCLC